MQTVGTFGKGVRGILLAGALVMVCGVLHAQVVVNFPDAENQLFITYISPGTEVPDETVTHTLGAGDSIVWTPYSTTFAEVEELGGQVPNASFRYGSIRIEADQFFKRICGILKQSHFHLSAPKIEKSCGMIWGHTFVAL